MANRRNGPFILASLLVLLSSQGCVDFNDSEDASGEPVGEVGEAIGGTSCLTCTPYYYFPWTSYDVATYPWPYGNGCCPGAVKIWIDQAIHPMTTYITNYDELQADSDLCEGAWTQQVIYYYDGTLFSDKSIHCMWINPGWCWCPGVTQNPPAGRIQSFKVFSGAWYYDPWYGQTFQLPIRAYSL